MLKKYSNQKFFEKSVEDLRGIFAVGEKLKAYKDLKVKTFVTFDSQRTGYIALKDLRKVAKELGELHDDTELLEMIERADFDQDGLVSEDEFYNLLTKKAY